MKSRKMQSMIFLKKNEERRLKLGHLWIFSNEIENTKGELDNGDITEVYDYKNNFVGTAFYNKNSLISGRMLSKNKITGLKEFFEEKIESAFQLRKLLYPGQDSFRLVFSESDFLPGLIIDKYNSTFVLQIYSAGMEKNINLIVDLLKEKFSAENIFTKNEIHFRKLEGLPETDEIYFGEIKDELIDDGRIKYKINFESGHKTGFYFDQNDNRFFIEKLCKDKTVLDAFSNAGGFGLHAAYSGAEHVTFVDSSAAEIESARGNFELNGFSSPSQFIVDDLFEYFKKSIQENKKFDVVIIDPPAFAKSKKALHTAKKGYEKLNKLAMQCLNENGFLVTSSCSFHLDENDFLQLLNSASAKAEKNIQLISFNRASLDHPELPAMKESRYLKCAVLKV
jgi:23S rRNA (cytosine1962-C5)-methyltransferase